MRRLVCLLLMSIGLACAASPAGADSPWYVTGDVGALMRMDASRSTTFSNSVSGVTGPGRNKVTFDTGPVVDLSVGYRLPRGFRIEGELGYAHDSVTSAYPLSTSQAFPEYIGNRLALHSGGGRDGYSGTINAFYDVPVSGPFAPYVGAGFGVEDYEAATARFEGAGGAPKFTEFAAHQAYAAVLGEAGIAIKLDKRWSIVPSYRFEHLFTGMAFGNDANIVKVGLRYSL